MIIRWMFACAVLANIITVFMLSIQPAPMLDLSVHELNARQVRLLRAGTQMLPEQPAMSAVALLGIPMTAAAPVPVPETVVAPSPEKPPAPVAKPEPKPTIPVPAPVVAKTAVDSQRSGKQVCYRWGGFGAKQVDSIQAQLVAAQLGGVVKTETVLGTPTSATRYWVYLPAKATHAEALTWSEAVKNKGFDNYVVVNEGEFKDTLSLGLFSSAATADALRAQLNREGLNAKVDVRGAPRATIFVFNRLDEAQSTALLKITGKWPEVKAKRVVCPA